jgi:outer membrane protein, heavy metal efflux system
MPVGFGVPRRTAPRVVSVLALTSVFALVQAREAIGQDAALKRPLGQELPLYVPESNDLEPRRAPEIQNPSGSLSLRDALSLALVQNPGLAAFAWETRAREARVIQAGRPPNPVVSVLLEDLGARQFAAGGVNEPVQPQTTIQLSQLIELGGKRAARERLAVANRDLAAWDYETARVAVLTQVARAFIDVLAAQETVAQIERTTRLVQEVRQTVGLRVTAGVVSPIEETRASVAAASVELELARARRLLAAGRIRLVSLWGGATAAFTSVEGSLQALPTDLPTFEAITLKVEQNPELARWATEVVQREATVAVERSKAVPDVSVVGGYRRFTEVDANAFVIGASISLPILDKNRAGIQEAQGRLAKAYEERRAVEGRVLSALADAFAVLAAAHDEIITLRDAVLPGSQQAFEAVSEGYRLGRFGYLDVLESQRTLIAAGNQFLRALADYHKAVADVERLMGAPLSDAAGRPTARE